MFAPLALGALQVTPTPPVLFTVATTFVGVFAARLGSTGPMSAV